MSGFGAKVLLGGRSPVLRQRALGANARRSVCRAAGVHVVALHVRGQPPFIVGGNRGVLLLFENLLFALLVPGSVAVVIPLAIAGDRELASGIGALAALMPAAGLRRGST